MDIHVFDIGQVADYARHHDIALVFHCPSLAAIAHAQVSAPLVGAERHEQDRRTLIDEMPAEFRKFRVVADQYADRPAIGIDRGDPVAALDIPPVGFVRCRVDLVAPVDGPVAQEDESRVADVAAFAARRVRAADDVDVVAQRQAVHERLEPLGIFGDPLDALCRGQGLFLDRQELQREQFREDDEIAAVIGSDVDEIFDLVLEGRPVVDFAHLQLHRGDAHRICHGQRIGGLVRAGAFDIERVAPDHVRCVAERIVVVGVIFVEDADRLEIVGHMKADRGIAQLAVCHGREIVGGVRIGAPPLRVARHAPAEHDALQAEMFAQCAPRFVQALADAQPPVGGVDTDLHAVEPVAVRIVA